MEDRERSPSRILLAIDTGSLTGPALEAAAALAVGLDSELAALFVEDERLLRLGLPLAHGAGSPSAPLHALGLDAIEHAFRVQVNHLRRLVEATAARFALSWTLDVARGELLATSLARLRPEDLLVLGRGRLSTFPVDGLAGADEAFYALPGRPIAVLYEESPAGERGLQAALALARVIAGGVMVLVRAQGLAAFRTGRDHAASRFAGRSAPVRYAFLASEDPHALVRTVRAQGAGALVLSGVVAERPTIEMLEAVACPVVLRP